MAAATVANPTTTRKLLKVFRATLRDEAGTLAKVEGEILFFSDAGEIIEVEPEDCVWLCVSSSHYIRGGIDCQ